MKTLILTFFVTALTFGTFSQNYSIPQNYKLEKAEDYAPYEDDVVKTFDWFMKTPANAEASKRKEAGAFLIKWLSGSPNVQLELNEKIVTFMGSSPELLIVFLGGWAKYSLESNDFDNKIAGNMAGLEAIITYYESNKSILPKDSNVEKFVKMKNKGTLKGFVEKNA